MTNFKRITDANFNRSCEAARILEEIARFILDDKELSETLKNIRHKLNKLQDNDYDAYLQARDTQNDVGTDIKNITKRTDIYSIFKANIKRLQQALRALAEYSDNNTDTIEKIRYNSYTLEKIMWSKLKEQINKIKIADKKLYLITNIDKFKCENDYLDAIAAALSGGVDIVQLREKNLSTKKLIELGKKVKQLCLQYDATFIVNDRADIALALDADGVHLGQDDMDIKTAREILGDNAIIGISTQNEEHAKCAIENGADYLGIGPVFDTPTKTDCPKIREEYLKWVSENVKIPAFAIGGIDLETIKSIKQFGIKKAAVVRAILYAKDPKQAAQDFLEVINENSGN